MNNTDLPGQAQLPSGKQLIISTIAAAAIATALLITTVLPAEYGIDPTGIGRTLGLTQMGEIKTSLAREAAQDAAKTAPSGIQEEAPMAAATTSTAPVQAAVLQRHQRSFSLPPGAKAEYKLVMRKDARVSYRWSAQGGKINYNAHADSPSINYHGYKKGNGVAADEGELVAAFDGNHGWSWRNRSGAEVTVTFTTEGDYQSIIRIQ